MRIYGTGAISDLLGDGVVYRSLRPADARLPGGPELAARLGLQPGAPLRKGDTAYARVAAAILRAARALDAPDTPLERLVVLGDTRLGDGGALASLCAETGWRGRGFICAEAPGEPRQVARDGALTLANRWAALRDFETELDNEGFEVDARTAVAIDLDKTLLGARGRNDALIDQARLQALRESVAELLGGAFDGAAFEQTYRVLNQAALQPLTADNQDYVAFLCVMVDGGLVGLEELQAMLADGRLGRFEDVLALSGERAGRLTPGLRAFRDQIAGLVAQGDPTPFKGFRRREYRETLARMGYAGLDTPALYLLRTELVLTGEVWELALRWRGRGALLFGLSDKPDEAAMPDGDGEPVHCARTHIVGE